MDGVFEPAEDAGDFPETMRFRPAAELTPEAVAAIAEQVRVRVLRWFARSGLIEADDVREMLAWENSGYSLDATVRSSPTSTIQRLWCCNLLILGCPKKKVGTTRSCLGGLSHQVGADPRWRLFGELQAQLLQQELLILLRLGIPAEDQRAPIGGGQMHVDHLQGGELLQRGSRCQTWRAQAQALLEGNLQAVGEESDKDVRLDPIITLLEDRADRQVALEFLERLFNFGEL